MTYLEKHPVFLIITQDTNNVRLEIHPEHELQLAGGAGAGGAIVGGGKDCSEGGIVAGVYRVAKLGTIEEVEHLGSEVQVDALGQVKGFRDAQVGLPKAWATKTVAAGLAVGPVCREGKGRRVQPEGRAFVRSVGVAADVVGSLALGLARRNCGSGAADGYCERCPGPRGEESAQVPAAVPVASSEWKSVNAIGREGLADIVVGVAAVTSAAGYVLDLSAFARTRIVADRVTPQILHLEQPPF